MYADLLAKIKNAGWAKKEAVVTTYSGLDFEIAKILARENYIKEAQKKNIGKKVFLEIKLRYNEGSSGLSGFKIISKSSRHLYFNSKEIKSVRHGFGIGIISTSRGIMTNKEARRNKVGGEYLIEVW